MCCLKTSRSQALAHFTNANTAHKTLPNGCLGEGLWLCTLLSPSTPAPLQIKYGNYLPVEREPKQEELSLQRQELLGRLDPLENKSLRQLENLEDAVSEDTLEVYRRKRLQELKERQAKAKFGSVHVVGMTEYIRGKKRMAKLYGVHHAVFCRGD